MKNHKLQARPTLASISAQKHPPYNLQCIRVTELYVFLQYIENNDESKYIRVCAMKRSPDI